MTDPIRQDYPVNSKSPFTIAPILKARSIFQKWLYLPEPEIVDLVISIPASIKVMKTEPIWLLLKGVPGCGKTELINSVSKLNDLVFSTSSLTPNALISGFNNSKDPGKDYSLLPQLDGRTLLIKDLTTILSMPVYVRDQIFGILRDAYDGSASRVFGTGTKSYTSKFNMIAGVTSAIEDVHHFNSLGERFLTWKIVVDHAKHAQKALTNFNKEDQMREEIQLIVNDVVNDISDTVPSLPEELKTKFHELSSLSCRLRVHTGRQHNKKVSREPESEVPTRVMKQLIRMAQGLALVRKKSKITLSEFNVAKKVAMNSMPSVRSKTFFYLYDTDKYVDPTKLSTYLKISKSSAKLVLDDLKLLKIVDTSTVSKRIVYRLTDEMRNQWRLLP